MHDKHVFGITVMIDHDTEKFCKRMSWHYSTSIKADDVGDYKSAINHYSAGVNNIDVIVKRTTDEEYLSILTDRHGAIIHRIETLKSFKTLP